MSSETNSAPQPENDVSIFSSTDSPMSSVNPHSSSSTDWHILRGEMSSEPSNESRIDESEQEIRNLIRVRVGPDSEGNISRELIRLNVGAVPEGTQIISQMDLSSNRQSDSIAMDEQDESTSPRARRLQSSRRSTTVSRCSNPQRPTKQSSFSYCSCPNFKTGRDLSCKCGEEDNGKSTF